MDVLTDISTKIAEATVPDEIDLAPLITEAFIRGGKEKESLFKKQQSTELGASGLFEGTLIFPFILNGMAASLQSIEQFLYLDEKQVGLAYYFLGISHYLGISDKVVLKGGELAEKYEKSLKSLFDTFSSELRASGLSKEKCNQIIANVLATLRKDISESLAFLEKLAGSK